MANTKFETEPASQGNSRPKRGRNETDNWQAASGTGRHAGGQGRSASAVGSTLGHHVKTLLADQVGSGADMIARFAGATRKAADDLEMGSPQAASFVGGVAERLDAYAETLREQSIDDLVSAASDYTRRKPALVFGVAALAGFVVMRTFKNASANRSGPVQNRSMPGRGGQTGVY